MKLYRGLSKKPEQAQGDFFSYSLQVILALEVIIPLRCHSVVCWISLPMNRSGADGLGINLGRLWLLLIGQFFAWRNLSVQTLLS